jgi:hypothetical protein
MKNQQSALSKLFPLIDAFIHGVFAKCFATTRGPLLSLGASGSIANALTFSNWKGIPTARGYTIPANPRTTSQTKQRTALTDTVDAWRQYVTDALVRTGWNNLAALAPSAMSGFNMFTQNGIRTFQNMDNSGFVGLVQNFSIASVVLNLISLTDGTANNDATPLLVEWGLRKNTPDFSATLTPSPATLVLPSLAADFQVGDTVYVRVSGPIASVASYRSGSIPVTLI